jgi:DNA primase
MSEEIDEICRRETIEGYLGGKGIHLQRAGKRLRCSCPLPGHATDKTPSFYVTTKPDGTQLFYCFGCNQGGSIISLMRLFENKKAGQVIRELSDKHGIDASAVNTRVRQEPLPYETLADFCEEDEIAKHIVTMAKAYMDSCGNTEDAVNKVSRLYRRMDEMIERGNDDGLHEVLAALKNLILGRKPGMEAQHEHAG